MCGIFGIITNDTADWALFSHLAEQNKVRGNRAFGYLTLHKEAGPSSEQTAEQVNIEIVRHTTPFEPGLITATPARLILGHICAPTGGRITSLEQVHPFETHNGYLAHNGLLLNHQQFPQWRLTPGRTVDSQVIAGGIQHFLAQGLPPPQAIKQTVERLDGQQACWYWHKPSGDLYLWRVMSPIYVGQDGDTFCFSSVEHASCPQLLAEGVIHRLERETLLLMSLAEFSYFSPYKVS